jgi:ABC-type cobalamin/Fe3+-siderophores transport system ATPase subunit
LQSRGPRSQLMPASRPHRRLVLHDLSQVATSAERLVVLDQGQVVATSEPCTVLDADFLRDSFGVHAAVIREQTSGRRHGAEYAG